MTVVMTILRIYVVLISILMFVYMGQHILFTFNRLFARQRVAYGDICDSELPTVSVLLPMHNEEKVLTNIMDALLRCDYDREKLEILAINDHSEDRTQQMLEEYAHKYAFIRILNRTTGQRGKPAALNDALKTASGDIILVFDADYLPPRDIIKKLVMAFQDPQVGAVMGRVVPSNSNTNINTNLFNLERSSGYQVDQQARYNLNLIPQYGGTAGGFRKSIMIETGGFDTSVLAEDTELTYRLYASGWRVVYDNSMECYEEAPETWKVRGGQIRRWARGHNMVMFKYMKKILSSRHLRPIEKLDGALLLMVYLAPFLFGIGMLDCLVLFFMGDTGIMAGGWMLLFTGVYSIWGNFSPFFQIGTSALIDGMAREVMILPMVCFIFFYYMWNTSRGFIDAIVDLITGRETKWLKTERFADIEETDREGASA